MVLPLNYCYLPSHLFHLKVANYVLTLLELNALRPSHKRNAYLSLVPN